MEVAGEDNASFCVGVVQQDRQTVPCRCKFVVGSLHRTEQRALAATAPPASGQAPQSPSPASVLTHAHGNGLTVVVVVVVVASAAGIDRTSTHRIHIGEEAKVWNGRSLASSTVGPDSEHSDSPTAYRATAVVRPWTAAKTWRRESGRQAWIGGRQGIQVAKPRVAVQQRRPAVATARQPTEHVRPRTGHPAETPSSTVDRAAGSHAHLHAHPSSAVIY